MFDCPAFRPLFSRSGKSDDVELLEIGDGAGHQAIKRENEDDGTDDAVDEPHGADVEVCTHLVHKEGDNRPPHECTHNNEGIAQNNVIELVFRQGEAKSCEQRDDQEHDERIAQGEQETRHHVAPLVVALDNVFGNLADGVVDNHVQGIDDQDDTADDLQQINVVGNEVGHQRDAQTHQQAIEQIAGSSPHAREEARMTATVQRALDAKDTDRSHGCRQDNTY